MDRKGTAAQSSNGDASQGDARVSGRLPYTKPAITAYGRVVDMTRAGGPSPGEARNRPKAG